MTDELIKKNTFIILIGLISFLIISSFIWANYAKKIMQDDLVNVSEIINYQLNDQTDEEKIRDIVNSFTNNDSWLEVIVAKETGEILINSSSDAAGETHDAEVLEDKEINKSNPLEPINNRLYSKNNYLFFITKLDNGMIVRTSIELKNTNYTLLVSLLFIVIVALMVMFLSIFFTKKTTNRISLAFNQISDNLQTIADGTYQDIDTKNNYIEVEEALKKIKIINKNIYSSMLAIKNEREKLQFIINNIDQGIIIIDGNGKVILSNEYAVRLIDDKVNVGDSYESFNFNELTIKHIKDAINKRIDSFFDVKKLSNDLIYFCTINCFNNQWKEISESDLLIIMKFSDVTERRLAEKRKSQFITNASHELKTPITSISGFSELLLATADNLSPSNINYLNIIHDESSKMKNLIEEIALISNIENRFEQFDFDEEVYLDEIVEEVFKIEEIIINKKELKIINNTNHIMIKSNKLLIDNVVRNLIDNAIKYNKQNGSIEVDTIDNDNVLTFIIKDTGIGIEEKYLDQIFERFYRVDKSHNNKVEGSGIGLDLVKQICIIINAKINVESKINVGTTFTIQFNKDS